MKRLVVLALALTLPLLPARTGAAGEPAWCHQVRSGQTLAGIARRYHIPVDELRRLNRSGSKAIPRVGSLLLLPRVLQHPPLRATPGRLRRESLAAARDRLSRMRDDRMVGRFRRSGLLVAIPPSSRAYYVAGVRDHLRVARPWVRQFVDQLADAFHGIFERRLRITSLTRTTRMQRALRRTNPSAAPAHGAVQSTHLTGAALDLSKRGLSDVEIAWLRQALDRLRRKGLIHVAEEFGEPHFHVMVRRRYADHRRRPGSPVLAGGC